MNYFLSMFVIRVITRLEIICIEMLCFYSYEDWLDKEYLSDMIFQYTSERYPIFGFDHNLDDLLYDDPMFDSLKIKPSFSMLVLQYLTRFEIVCIEMLLFWFCQNYDPNSKVYKDASLLDETIFYHKYERYPVLYGHRHNSGIFTLSIFALTD